MCSFVIFVFIIVLYLSFCIIPFSYRFYSMPVCCHFGEIKIDNTEFSADFSASTNISSTCTAV